MAYLTAKTYGLVDLAQEILDECQVSEDSIVLPSTPGKLLRPPAPILKHYELNWPVNMTKKKFDMAQSSQPQAVPSVAAAEPEPTGWGDDLDVKIEDSPLQPGDEGAGWDIDAELDIPADADMHHDADHANGDSNGFIVPTKGLDVADVWCRNSSLAVDHIAAGNFESAMQLLNRQVGVVNFAPLKPLFLQVAAAVKTYSSGLAPVPPISSPVHRHWSPDHNKLLPFTCISISHAQEKLQEAYSATTAGR